jgi:hypothetical protein
MYKVVATNLETGRQIELGEWELEWSVENGITFLETTAMKTP